MMRQQTVIVLALLVAAVSVVGAASYTDATVDRDAGIQVSADNAALVGLEVGGGISASDDSVKTSTDGELVLNLDDEGTGVNGNATFHYGASSARDRSKTAFNVTNNDDASRDFTLSYDNPDANSKVNVKFEVYTYDSTRTTPFQKLGTVDDEGTTQTATLAQGDKLYIFTTVDTTKGDIGSGQALSGNFTVTAT